MSQGPNRYRVEASAATKALLRETLKRAYELGVGETVASTARQIMKRLETDPLIFGEPVHQLRRMKLEMRVGIISPLSVEYGVDAESRIVYIKHFYLSGEPGR